jgi:hypothetical protein
MTPLGFIPGTPPRGQRLCGARHREEKAHEISQYKSNWRSLSDRVVRRSICTNRRWGLARLSKNARRSLDAKRHDPWHSGAGARWSGIAVAFDHSDPTGDYGGDRESADARPTPGSALDHSAQSCDDQSE